nr:LLM class flavin-dependent oxidoreductase [Rhodococcus koreensis]
MLLAALGARTSRIRLGSGGVMLPNHQPLVVAEQFLMLEAVYPGRIDLGVGRSLGFTKPVREALRRDRNAPDTFADDLDEVRNYLEGKGTVTARPQVASPRRCSFSRLAADSTSPRRRVCRWWSAGRSFKGRARASRNSTGTATASSHPPFTGPRT